jgi:hypothetical protein
MGPVHSAYNPSFSAYFFSQNSIFLSQQIRQQCFSAGLSTQQNGAMVMCASYATSILYLHTTPILISARPTSRHACHGLSEIEARVDDEAANPPSFAPKIHSSSHVTDADPM